jgi:hypothetical protein
MKTALKVIVLFLIVFNWNIPLIKNTTILSTIITTVYYFMSRRTMPVYQFRSVYLTTIVIGSLVLSFVCFSIAYLHANYGYNIHQKRIYLMLAMILSMILAIPLFVEGKEDHAFEEMAKIVGLTFALQGAIHLTGFLYRPFGEYIAQMTGHYRAYLLSQQTNIKSYRFFALAGSIFFELPGAYGAASIILFRLLLIQGQKFLSGYWSIIVLFFIFAGICLSGRTGFIGFFMGLAYYLYFVPKQFPNWEKSLTRWATFAIVLLGLFFGALSQGQRDSITGDLFPFAFEAYYTYKEHGTFSTGSTDVTTKVHYYPLRSETLLFGHGTSPVLAPGYRHTDAGYMDVLIYGGVPYLLILSIYQILYFIRPIRVANSRGTPEGRHDLFFFFTLLVYIFILEYKGCALGTQHYTEVLFSAAAMTYLIRYHYRVKHGIEKR